MNRYTAAEFFEGSFLALGQVIALGQVHLIASLARDLDLNTHHGKGITLLHFAMLQMQPDAVMELVRLGADPLVEVEGLGSAVGCAVMAEDPVFLNAMFRAGVSPNITDRYGMPLFFFATTKDSLATLHCFIARGVNLNAATHSGQTAILHAFFRLKYDQVEFLIEQGVAVDVPTDQGMTLAYTLERELERQRVDPTTEAYRKLVRLKDMLVGRGVRFPAETPESILRRMAR